MELLQAPQIMMTGNESAPSKVDNDYLRLAGWEMSVSSTIDSMASSDQVIEGWNLLQTNIGSEIIFRLFQPFFILTVIDASGRNTKEIRVHEPRVIELLRFSYWYSRISKYDKTNTFSQKASEIKGKLARKALSNVEDYKTTTINHEFVTDQQEFDKQVSSSLSRAKQGKTIDSDFETYIKELRRTLWSVISELQLAGICQDSGLSVSFIKPNYKIDYDIIIDGIPSQVKSITTEDDNARDFFKRINDRIDRYINGQEIEEYEVEETIRDDILYRYRSIIKAIDQGVKIVLINGTHSYSGFLANKYASDRCMITPLKTVIETSISLLRKEDQSNQSGSTTKNIHVIFGAGAIDIKYRYSAWGFQIPYDTNTKTLKLEEMKKI